MIPSDAFMDLIAIGYRVEYGYLFFDRYRYGRISEDALLTEGDPSVPIPWTEIAGFEDTDQGSFGHHLSIVRPDGSKTELKRSELPAAEKYSGLRPKKDLAAVLCSGSFPEDPGIPTPFRKGTQGRWIAMSSVFPGSPFPSYGRNTFKIPNRHLERNLGPYLILSFNLHLTRCCYAYIRPSCRGINRCQF